MRFFSTENVWKSDSKELYIKSFLVKRFPFLKMNLRTSVAWINPIIPGTTPRTPASFQLGTEPEGGGSGKRQRRQGPPSIGANTLVCPSNLKTPP